MTQQELLIALKAVGLPVAYGSFASAVTPPFITYQFAYGSDLIADNINYAKIRNFQIELYTVKNDPPTQKLVEDKLEELQLPYSNIETWLDAEKMYQILYEIQIIGG